MNLIQIALEQEADQGVQKEQEVVIYCKIGDVIGLEQAQKIEHHLQAQIKTGVGSIRVRRTTGVRYSRTDGQQVGYEQTTKTIDPEALIRTMDEYTLPIDEKLFSQFMAVADSYMDKTRYSFRVEKVTISADDLSTSVDVGDLWFEVDVFKNAAGEQSQWCKIDVEVQELGAKLKGTPFENTKLNLKVGIGKLPFRPTDFVLEAEDGSEDKKALIKELYATQFLIQNPRLAKQ